MKKTLLLMAISLISNSFVQSQSGQVKKITLTADQVGGILNLYENGLAIRTSDKRQYEFTFYDTDLKKSGTAKFLLEGKRAYINSTYFDTILNKILVVITERKKNTLLVMSSDGKKKKFVDLVSPAKSTINTNFITIDKTTYLLVIKKKKVLLCTIEIDNGKVTPIEMPEEWKARTILKIMRVNSKYLSVFYLDKKVKNKTFKNVALLDDDGKVVEDMLVTNEESDFPIEEFSITDLGNDELAIAGTYGSNIKSDYSIGMFVAKLENLKLSYIKYFDYNSIKNFYNFLPEKKKEKAEKRAEKNAKKGRSTKYLAVTHPVVVVNGNLVVTAEFFYPTYRTEVTTTNVNGSAQTTSRQVFDGYQYTHTMILGVDNNGNKEFEYCIPFYLDYKPYYASQRLKRRINGDEIKYSYIASNKIYSFSITNDILEVNDPKKLVEVDEDKKLKSVSSNIDSWYDNYFYSLISYTTKEKGKVIGGKETNYFLLKLAVE